MKLPILYNKFNSHVRRLAREQYIVEQESKCYYCYSDLNKLPPKKITNKPINVKLFPRGFFQHPLHLHHDHKTALHKLCTVPSVRPVLWQYEGE